MSRYTDFSPPINYNQSYGSPPNQVTRGHDNFSNVPQSNNWNSSHNSMYNNDGLNFDTAQPNRFIPNSYATNNSESYPHEDYEQHQARLPQNHQYSRQNEVNLPYILHSS